MDNGDRSVGDGVAAARRALALGEHPTAAPAAFWHWHLASGRLEWNEGLRTLFGYAVAESDAAWREERIHPEDRERVKLSLERATIVNHGSVWSERFRFRNAAGTFTPVVERAYVVSDAEGPRRVLGTITPIVAGH